MPTQEQIDEALAVIKSELESPEMGHALAVMLGRKGGKSRSPAKLAAVAQNAKKGGRPKKSYADPVENKKLMQWRENQRRYRERNPQKHLAHRMTQAAIKNGTIIPMPCEVCGELKVEAHHDDYTKPLAVRWLCKKHHWEERKRNGHS